MGPPKATPNKQKNTLFSYFTKSPAVTSPSCSATETKDVLSPKRSPNQSKGSIEKKSKTVDYEPGDLLWCKLEGYPWWPCLVCNHPTSDTYYKAGKTPEIHVMFFDTPVSRAWIKLKNCRLYEGSDCKDFQPGGVYHSKSMPVVKGAEEADKALKLSKEDRLSLVVDLQPSDEEEEDDDMEFDADIFDTEMTDEEDNSKENLATKKEEKKTKKTPSKSPAKGRRSERSKAKRRRILVESDSEAESEDEFKPPPEEGSEDEEASSGVDEDDISSDDASEPDSPVKLPKKRKRPEPKPSWGPKTARKPMGTPKSSKKTQDALAGFSNVKPESTEGKSSDVGETTKSPVVSENTKSKLALFSASDSAGTVGSCDNSTVYQHHRYEWLKPDKIRDAQKRGKNDPDYDPRTVFIPENEKTKFTPAMRQWWEIKSQHFDTVLFFKMGKFYELFHMDAVVAVTELGLIYMKGDYAHSGFPEIAYGRYADTLVQKGYKVARIEQTETPEMMTERCKKLAKAPSKFDKVVKREVCRITTKGTKTFSFLSGECADSQSSYLLALAEKENEGYSNYGVCFVDTSIGKFYIGQFEDDRHCSRLRTLLAHYPPVQLLQEKGKLSQRTLQVISNSLTSVMKEYLNSKKEFWDSAKTLKVLAEETYFKQDGETATEWPEALKTMMADSDAIGTSAKEEYDLAVSSLGAVTWYLQYSLMDEELLSMRNFEVYSPVDSQTGASQARTVVRFDLGTKHMVLDGVTLANLDITQNSSTGTLDGTLLERLDQCRTPFGNCGAIVMKLHTLAHHLKGYILGKRLFRQWLCAPLCNPASINDRLDALEDLMGCQDVVADVVDMMKKLPDLERMLSRIHTLGTKKKDNHPDGRAIMYEDVTYSKRKIEDFLATLDGFKVAMKVAARFKDVVDTFKSQLLKKTLGLETEGNGGFYPDLSEDLRYFDNAFDHKKAKKDGAIVPSKGVDSEYDESVADMKSTEDKLQSYLDKQRSRLGCRSIVYWGTGKNRYQLEVPESNLRNLPHEYQLMSSKKGWKRYRTSDIEELLAQMVDAEERKNAAMKDVMRRIFHSFDDRYKKWDTTLQCLSVLDVLLSMAKYSRCADGTVCRPEITIPDENTEPFIEIREARHPCVSRTFSGDDFIPNDTVIGIQDENDMETDEAQASSKVVLVTGPNMGGKSTLMRQVGQVIVMAQMGCYVPAEKCRFTPVDRVFTRLGASDRIMEGESTFFVELSETSSILQHATRNSLVLVDELGRGTATYDGTAIACSVVQELSQNIRCRTLFSTHYHSLVEEFSHDPNIRLGHMACMVENEDEKDPTQETITFLYKFTSGSCPKSYGFNVARLADLPEEVIKTAVNKAKEFEESLNTIKAFRSIWKSEPKELPLVLKVAG